MLLYNKTYFDNFYLLQIAKEWKKSGTIGEAEYTSIAKQYPSPYKSFHIFARLGLFIFTQFALGSFTGLFNLMFMEAHFFKYVTFQFFFFGSISYVLAELSIRTFSFFKTGIKGALLYAAVSSLCLGMIGLITNGDFNFDTDLLSSFICVFPIIAFTAIRFADKLLSFCAFACVIIINALVVLKMGTFGKIILPFESMAVSYFVYYLIGKFKDREELHYWRNCMVLVETLSLITLYLSGNYMVIRVLTVALLDTPIGPGEDIPLAFFFYAYTIIVPLIYVWIGLKKKDYTFLRAGLILEIGGILAIKYYHSFLPPETAMSLGGIVLILLAYVGIKYLKTPRNGITFELYKRSSRDETLTNIASVLVSKVVADQQMTPKPEGIEPGGGQFGGGGAGADY
ncbi:MAG TPA: hypothetical protein VK808_03265 [Bacteroidia bacterium]|jgi:hypothetical protein|nr:hypothetical protein [Bacteroidia bacterium]